MCEEHADLGDGKGLQRSCADLGEREIVDSIIHRTSSTLGTEKSRSNFVSKLRRIAGYKGFFFLSIFAGK